MYLYAQTDEFRCGPIAAANVFALVGKDDFAGSKITRKVINKDISDAVGCSQPNGTWPRPLFDFVSSIIRFYNCKVKRIKNFYIRDLDKLLDRGHILLIDYMRSKDSGHYFVIDKRTSKTYRCYNFDVGVVISYVSKKEMRALIRKHCAIRDKYSNCRSTASILAIRKYSGAIYNEKHLRRTKYFG